MVLAIKKIQTLLLVTLLMWSGTLFAHGLHMSTAQIVQRQENYLYITINTSLSEIFNHMDYQEKPVSLVHMANGPAEQVSQFRQALLDLFREQFKLTVAGKPLESVNVKTVPTNKLRYLLQEEVAERIINSNVKHSNHYLGRENYLRIEVDGFISGDIEQRFLHANFPKELGQILVSYTKPSMQTISPDETGSQYIQVLLK